MKEYLKQIIEETSNPLLKKSVVREYLQARVLQALQDAGVFLQWAFLGGTALRFLYNMPRYSEDLDFSLIASGEKCEFTNVLRKIKVVFESEDYDIDTNPPEGADTSTTLVRRYVTVNVNHYDKASLLSAKLHAVLSRQYTKGRDLYDLVWYLSDNTWPSPNFHLLNCALKQTAWKGREIDQENIKDILAERMSEIQWNAVKDDLLPFLERPRDIELITRDNCLKLIPDRQF